jgi:glycosyltransferase involved in cell wall biosynthesis
VDVEVVTSEANPEQGSFGARAHSLLLMLSQFARVHCLLTASPEHARIPGVTFAYAPLPKETLVRARRSPEVYATRPPDRPAWPRPDVLVVQNLDALAARQNLPDVPVVLDDPTLSWDRLRFRARSLPGAQSASLLRGAVQFEEDAIREVQGVLASSKAVREEILARAPEAGPKIHLVRDSVDTSHFRVTAPEDETASALFVGDFTEIPNREAATVVVGEFAPKLPLIPFLLVGRQPPANLRSVRNVLVMGHVEDLRPVLARAGVCIAPLVHGSGARIKILTYLAAGKAVVATTRACEGLGVVSERHLLVRDGWPSFVAGIRRLLGDPVWRLELGRAGRDLVKHEYDWRLLVPDLKHALEDAILAG